MEKVRQKILDEIKSIKAQQAALITPAGFVRSGDRYEFGRLARWEQECKITLRVLQRLPAGE